MQAITAIDKLNRLKSLGVLFILFGLPEPVAATDVEQQFADMQSATMACHLLCAVVCVTDA